MNSLKSTILSKSIQHNPQLRIKLDAYYISTLHRSLSGCSDYTLPVFNTVSVYLPLSVSFPLPFPQIEANVKEAYDSCLLEGTKGFSDK